MGEIIRYTEPLHVYIRRKYLELGLSFLPLVAAGALYWALLRGGNPPPWAILYAATLAVVLPSVLLLAFRNRWERRRFRIGPDSIGLPSLVRIDGFEIESLTPNSVLSVGAVRGEIGLLGLRTQTEVAVEIRIRHKEEDITLVWPIRAFGRENFGALTRVFPGHESYQ